MKAIVKKEQAKGAQLVTDVDVPKMGPNDALVKVKATSICGTDLHVYEWNEWAQHRVTPPFTMGHELCGVIEEVGERVSSVAAGDLVSAETHIYCGTCFQCTNGRAHICENVKILGVDTDGVFADYAVIPEKNLWKNPPSMKPEIASIQEPFGNAVHTALECDDIAGSTVAVFGCGPVGLCAVAVAKAVGASEVFAVETTDYRLDLAKKLGADAIFNPAKEDAASAILKATGNRGVDVILEMSGNARAIKDEFTVIRPGGTISILGIPSKPVEIDLAHDVVFKSVKVIGINGRKIWSTWHKTSALLKKIDISPLITHRIKLDEFEEGMNLMENKTCGKVVMFP